jgi:hypothetical protein
MNIIELFSLLCFRGKLYTKINDTDKAILDFSEALVLPISMKNGTIGLSPISTINGENIRKLSTPHTYVSSSNPILCNEKSNGDNTIKSQSPSTPNSGNQDRTSIYPTPNPGNQNRTTMPNQISNDTRTGTTMSNQLSNDTGAGTTMPYQLSNDTRAGTTMPNQLSNDTRAGTTMSNQLSNDTRAGTTMPNQISNDTRAGLYYLRGVCYKLKDRFVDAIADFSESLSLTADDDYGDITGGNYEYNNENDNHNANGSLENDKNITPKAILDTSHPSLSVHKLIASESVKSARIARASTYAHKGYCLRKIKKYAESIDDYSIVIR